MEHLFLAEIVSIPKDDPVAFTFFTGYMAMFAASVFFFFETLLFLSAPLLLSFAVYFGIWHSLQSTFKQIEVIRIIKPDFTIYKHYLKSLPITILSVAGIVLVFFLVNVFNSTGMIGVFFIILSIISMPHVVIVDNMYKNSDSGKI
jgi:hypothetical protein